MYEDGYFRVKSSDNFELFSRSKILGARNFCARALARAIGACGSQRMKKSVADWN